jgi:hypothetical protein
MPISSGKTVDESIKRPVVAASKLGKLGDELGCALGQ